MDKYVIFEVKQERAYGSFYCRLETENKNFTDLNDEICNYMNLVKSMEYIATEANARGYGCYFTMA